MSEYWFKPRRYGFGARPSTWEGWTITLAYMVGALATAFWLAQRGGDLSVPATLAYVLGFAAATAAFVFVAWKRTEGGWRWRWGDKN